MKPAILFLAAVLPAAADLTAPNTPAPAAPALPAAPQNTPDGFEFPVALSASRILGGDAAGADYRVREQVPTDGYMAHFTIDSDYGTFQCVGEAQARARIGELAAIRKLVSVSKSDLFAEGVKRSIEQPIDAVKNIAQDPVGSAKAVPKTIGHLFKKVGRSVENAAKNVHEKIESGDSSGMGSGIGNAAKGVIGFDQAKLDCAKQLQVDPYTDNERLQEEMEKVTWVFFSGGMPLRIGAMAASGGASMALTATKVVGLPDEMYTSTPSELALRDQQAMEALSVPEAVIRKYQSNPALSITLRRSIIKSLAALGNPQGSAGVLTVASNCEARRQAEFIDQALRLLAARKQAGQLDLAHLEIIGRLPGAVDKAGLLHIPAPVDYLTWTSDVAAFANRDDLVGRKPQLLTRAGMSDRSRAELGKLGWTVAAP